MTLTTADLQAAILALKFEIRVWRYKEDFQKVDMLTRHLHNFMSELKGKKVD